MDKVISAEIPSREDDPDLYEVVMRCNIHGPCGERCMRDGKCKKQFPKPFQEATDTSGDGYPKYRRIDNSNENHVVGNRGVDNRWVVPYNAFLSKTFNAHINVEMCHTIHAVKYLCKYFMKGHDRARVGLQVQDGALNLNEVQEFLDTRCVTPPEATWRLLENDLHQQSHTIYELSVHLKDGQRIYFNEGDEEAALREASAKDTSLTAWFKLNEQDPGARELLYQEIPTMYVLKKTGNRVYWQFRQRGGETVIGRVSSVSPRNVELYHLRLLLLNVRGATSFESLRTVNGVIHDTYREAAFALGLIADDEEWKRCMEDASVDHMPVQLRSLFAVILINCDVSDAKALWEQFKPAMIEDFLHAGNSEEIATSMALWHIQEDLQAAGNSCSDHGLPDPQPFAEQAAAQVEDVGQYAEQGAQMLDSLNEDQRAIADRILAALAIDDGRPKCFFIDGPGGTGKTFLYKTMINVLRGMGKRVLSVAWTGIAATLLPNGKTCHTAFRFPLNLQPDSSCHLNRNEKLALLDLPVILWDEAPMAINDALQVVDRVLRDLTKKDIPFSGKLMILGGDFRQIPPVIPRASRLQIVRKCIKKADLFRHFEVLHLKRNMRARPEEVEFAEWLLQLGNGTLPRPDHGKTDLSICLPRQCISTHVVHDVFGNSFTAEDTSIHQRVVLCPTNEDVRLLNEQILEKLQGEKVTYKSIDTVDAVEGEDPNVLQQMYPVEFLNTVSLSGLPPHELNLKKGAVVMLIRNLSLSRGLCNGTRLIVFDMRPKVLKLQVISGANVGSIHFLPRVTLNTKDTADVPFNLCRRQFPVKLAYALTINKAQGQTFEKVGVYLRTPVFSHGQLYVACSRARSFDALRIEVFQTDRQGKVDDDVVTDNVVYQELID